MKINRIIIGIEVHVELKTKTKMFCGCPADHFSKEPNTQTCPVCLGLPGSLPVPNQKAIDSTLVFGLAVDGSIGSESYFERKNYFYPDLPKGYQISQKDRPFVTGGSLKLSGNKVVNLREAHLEEDTAKLQHVDINHEKWSLIDFNRSGVPLLEIVTEPCLDSSDQAKEYLENLRNLIRWIDISDADMEKGSMRCEPNVNLEIEDKGKVCYTPIVEVKNINSFNFVKRAIDYETMRQFEEFVQTGQIKIKGNKQTRGWDEVKNITVLQRTKEEADDYRYFPEPDIPPFRFSKTAIARIKGQIADIGTPWHAEEVLITRFSLSAYQAGLITQNRQLVNKFTAIMEELNGFGNDGKLTGSDVANAIINKRLDPTVTPKQFVSGLASLMMKITITVEQLKEELKTVLTDNPSLLESYRKGRTQVLGVMVGLIKSKTGAIVDFQTIKNIIDSI